MYGKEIVADVCVLHTDADKRRQDEQGYHQ